MIVSKMKSIKEDVRSLLLEHEHYKDNDQKLIAAYYYRHYIKKELPNVKTAVEFLHDLADGKIPSPDTITRVRRKLQETEEELRGKKYKERHQLETETRNEIHEL
jgi:hypothetical protein